MRVVCTDWEEKMKHQYFGDIRDLFKYDIVCHLIESIPLLSKHTFIPMLTENDSRPDGNKTDYSKAPAGFFNIELANFLKSRVQENKRNIYELEDFFSFKGIELKIYGKDSGYFTQSSRTNYFADIPPAYLCDSLVFLDPDNGLEIKGTNHQHVLYSEISNLYNRMNQNSIIMVYQHFPRENHARYLKRRSEELLGFTGENPAYISDNEIIFFYLTKSPMVRSGLDKAL